MTVQEANENNTDRLTSIDKQYPREMICRYEDCDALEEHCPHCMEEDCECLQAIVKKLAEYEDLGTVEELKEAREKQIPKDVIFSDDGDSLLCPNCDFDLMGCSVDEKDPCYCPKCGKALKWGEEDD